MFLMAFKTQIECVVSNPASSLIFIWSNLNYEEKVTLCQGWVLNPPSLDYQCEFVWKTSNCLGISCWKKSGNRVTKNQQEKSLGEEIIIKVGTEVKITVNSLETTSNSSSRNFLFIYLSLFLVCMLPSTLSLYSSCLSSDDTRHYMNDTCINIVSSCEVKRRKKRKDVISVIPVLSPGAQDDERYLCYPCCAIHALFGTRFRTPLIPVTILIQSIFLLSP